MIRVSVVLLSLALTLPAAAAEVACEGPFGPGSSEALLKETFGAENVVTGEVDGPEGTTMLATTVFPNDPAKRYEFVWWDEQTLAEPGNIVLPSSDTAPGGVRIGMDVAEVEALNGEPFTLLGFYWDYGGSAGFQSGKLANLPGGCYLSVTFSPTVTLDGVDTSGIEGDQEVASDLPLLRQVKPVIETMSIGYPFPDFEGETEGTGEDAGAEM